MPEQKINFQSEDALTLEGLIHEGETDHGVVITHPHPLYGGDMYNNVVETIQQAYRDSGHTTLRFNFRGTGRSGGDFDDGLGEQNDILAALNVLKKKNLNSFSLAGYSFGSWVIGRMLDKITADSIIMVSPPAAMLTFESTDPIPSLDLVVTGSHDEFAPPDMIKGLVESWNPKAHFEVIRGADHFFFGFSDSLKKLLGQHI